MFYIVGLRCWGIDGILQMYLYVFVCYWFVLPLGEYLCTNVLAYDSYHLYFHYPTLSTGLFTLYMLLYIFFELLSNNLLVGGIPYLGFGILLLPNFCGGNLHVPDVTY